MDLELYPWLREDFNRLIRMRVDDRMPHALLIEGSKGVGKSDMSAILAQRLLCDQAFQQDNVSDVLPCGKCKQCLLFEAESHTDYKVLAPEDEGKAIKVDAVRSLVDFLQQSSFQGGYKVAVINPAEAMNVNAANALLKTLEEPTPRTLIVLLTNEPGMILPTIRSRCQVVALAKPLPEDALNWLSGKLASSPEVARQMLAMANGSPLLAKAYIEESANTLFDTMLAELAIVLKRQLSVSEIAENWADEHALTRVTWLCQWAQELINLSMLKTRNYPLPESAEKMFDYVCEKAEAQKLFDLYQCSIEQRALLMGSSNPNKVLLFEFLLTQWRTLLKKSAG